MIKSENRIFGLDLMRCIAILMVVYVHSVNMLSVLLPVKIIGPIIGKIIATTFFFGAFGVEMFFALSGFLIGGILIKTFENSNSLKDLYIFWIQRWFRTLPLYFLVLLVNFISYQYFNYKYILFVQNYFSSIENGFFVESWSLAVEEWSYIYFPLLFIVCNLYLKNSKKSFKYTLLFGILISWIVRLIYLYLGIFDLRSIVVTRLDAIFYGILMAFLISEKNPYLLKNAKYIFRYSLCLLIISYILLRMGAPPFDLSSKSKIFKYGSEIFGLPIINICYALLIPYLLHIGGDFKAWFKKSVIFISKISYSMYLWHFSFLYFFVFNLKEASRFSSSNIILIFIVYWITTILISYFSYKIIEIPFIKLRNKIFQKS